MRNGATIQDAAEATGGSYTWVYNACREFGVEAVSGKRTWPASRTYMVISRLFDADLTYESIALELGVSKQYVGWTYQQCVQAGIPVPERHRGTRAGEKQKRRRTKPEEA